MSDEERSDHVWIFVLCAPSSKEVSVVSLTSGALRIRTAEWRKKKSRGIVDSRSCATCFCFSAVLNLLAFVLRKVPIEGGWYRHQLVQVFFGRACVQMLMLYAFSFLSFSVYACIVANLTRVCKPRSRFYILMHCFSVLFRTELCAIRISR